MAEATLPVGRVGTPSALVREMGTCLRGYWTRVERYQQFLYIMGAALVASAVFHTGVLLVTGGSGVWCEGSAGSATAVTRSISVGTIFRVVHKGRGNT